MRKWPAKLDGWSPVTVSAEQERANTVRKSATSAAVVFLKDEILIFFTYFPDVFSLSILLFYSGIHFCECHEAQAEVTAMSAGGNHTPLWTGFSRFL